MTLQAALGSQVQVKREDRHRDDGGHTARKVRALTGTPVTASSFS